MFMKDSPEYTDQSWQTKLDSSCQEIMNTARANPEHVVLISGPTASGKSSLALCVAQALNGVILSADSMQIYRGFDIGTAKASHEEQRLISHFMIDIVDPDQGYSVAKFAADARNVLAEKANEGRTVIVCGGTGQYIQALLDGIVYASHAKDAKLRSEITAQAEGEGLTKLWQEIVRLDPDTAKIMEPTDSRRIIRFHELYRLTGKTRSEIDLESRSQKNQFKFLPYYLDPGKSYLNSKIAARVFQMIEDGLIDETSALLAKYPDTSLQPFYGIGYREVIGYLNGDYSYEEMAERIVIHTRQYAKRQRTWFRPRNDLIRI